MKRISVASEAFFSSGEWMAYTYAKWNYGGFWLELVNASLVENSYGKVIFHRNIHDYVAILFHQLSNDT